MSFHKITNEVRFRKCVDMAEHAENLDARQLWLTMAHTWRKLAEASGEPFDLSSGHEATSTDVIH